ncbi:MAG: 16S rRNA (adenine(1518)-N(6)/adenine(1519)-N(6))-dimethyltransferase RsmA [Oscillospiraceae bacterium]|jgi:16S rRNA (adenine1518-N6/adenine1519-N6)-dimethyltransferase
MNLCSRPDVQALLSRHGFRFSKSMGQNFLMDPSVPVRIADASGLDSSVGVLEIGPGIGALTVELAKRAGRVTAVELDRSLLPVLSETLAPYPNATVVSGNILSVNLKELVSSSFPCLTPVVCANLPYNITSPVLSALIDSGCFQRITVMVQKEVALRICAGAGTASYGAFSVYAQYHMEPELLFDVPPESFFPAPKVTSTVITMTPHKTPPAQVEDEAFFFKVVRAAFGQRRKTLVNALSAVFGSRFSKADLQRAIVSCGLPADIRGERLDIPAFAALASHLQGVRSA